MGKFFVRPKKNYSGVRQAGVLSPYLFAVYVDDVLQRLKKCGLGCHINHFASTL